LVIENKLNNTNDNEQLNALKQGFYEIIPQDINLLLDDVDLKVIKLIFNLKFIICLLIYLINYYKIIMFLI